MIYGEVTGDNEDFVKQWNSISFYFSIASVAICPEFDVVREAGAFLVKVIKENGVLSRVAIEPFVLWFYIEGDAKREACFSN